MTTKFVGERHRELRPLSNSLPGTVTPVEASNGGKDVAENPGLRTYALGCLKSSVEHLKRGEPEKAFEEASLARVLAEDVDPELFKAAGVVAGKASVALEAGQSQDLQDS